MRLLAIFLPPIAVFIAGKPIQALINFGLCFLFWLPAVIHAWGVVTDYKNDERMKKQVRYQRKLEQKGYEDQRRE